MDEEPAHRLGTAYSSRLRYTLILTRYKQQSVWGSREKIEKAAIIPYPCQGIVKRLTRVHTRRIVVKKHDVLALLREMPDDIDTDDLMYRLYLRQKLQAAEAAAETGDIIPHDEVVRRSDEWLQ